MKTDNIIKNSYHNTSAVVREKMAAYSCSVVDMFLFERIPDSPPYIKTAESAYQYRILQPPDKSIWKISTRLLTFGCKHFCRISVNIPNLISDRFGRFRQKASTDFRSWKLNGRFWLRMLFFFFFFFFFKKILGGWTGEIRPV